MTIITTHSTTMKYFGYTNDNGEYIAYSPEIMTTYHDLLKTIIDSLYCGGHGLTLPTSGYIDMLEHFIKTHK